MTRTMSLAGTSLDIVERGECRPLLFLSLLATRYRLFPPWHPGYGRSMTV
jgi:hypothetical protein